MNQRILKKQLGLKSTMKQRDYYSCRINEDRPELLKTIREMVEAEYGDIVWVITYKPTTKEDK